MFDFHDPGNPLLVLIGIIVAQLFLYGRKIKERVKIAFADLISDAMQFSVMYIVCMGFLTFAKSIIGWDLNDPWQLVTVVILFNMSFDTWFNRLRETFNSRVGAAFDVLTGKKTVEQEAPPSTIIVQQLKDANPPVRDHAMDDITFRLDNVSNRDDNDPR